MNSLSSIAAYLRKEAKRADAELPTQSAKERLQRALENGASEIDRYIESMEAVLRSVNGKPGL